MILRTRIRLKRMLYQKNDRSPFLPNEEGAPKGWRRALPGKLNKNRGKVTLHAEYMIGVEAAAFPIAPFSHSHTA